MLLGLHSYATLGGIKYVEWRDEARFWSSGYFDLTTYRASASFHGVNIFYRDGFTNPADLAPYGAGIFSDIFDNLAQWPQWTLYSGNWANTGFVDRYLYQGATTNTIGVAGLSGRTFADAMIEFTVQVTDCGGNSLNWVGMEIRKEEQHHRFGLANSGYLIYYRCNGQIVLFNPVDGQMTSGLAGSPLAERKVWIRAVGTNISVYVGAPSDTSPPHDPIIDHTDPNGRWRAGYIDFTTYAAAAMFDDLKITVPTINWPIISGSYATNWMWQLSFPAPATAAYRAAPLDFQVADFVADFAVRVDDSNNDSDAQEHWAAFAFRKTKPADDEFTSGYMLYIRQNGKLQLYSAGGGLLGAAQYLPAGAPRAAYQNIRIWAQGYRIRVFVNGSAAPILDVPDPSMRWSKGNRSPGGVRISPC